MAQDLPHGNGAKPTTFFLAGEEGGSTEVRHYFRWSSAGTKEVDHSQQSLDGIVGTIWGGAEYCFLEVIGPEAGWAGGGTVREGLQSLDDIHLRNLDWGWGWGSGGGRRIDLGVLCLLHVLKNVLVYRSLYVRVQPSTTPSTQ